MTSAALVRVLLGARSIRIGVLGKEILPVVPLAIAIIFQTSFFFRVLNITLLVFPSSLGRL